MKRNFFGISILYTAISVLSAIMILRDRAYWSTHLLYRIEWFEQLNYNRLNLSVLLVFLTQSLLVMMAFVQNQSEREGYSQFLLIRNGRSGVLSYLLKNKIREWLIYAGMTTLLLWIVNGLCCLQWAFPISTVLSWWKYTFTMACLSLVYELNLLFRDHQKTKDIFFYLCVVFCALDIAFNTKFIVATETVLEILKWLGINLLLTVIAVGTLMKRIIEKRDLV
ncbi:hypothetical protein [Bulleidia sp. zg-1006]|uniref:hypothetical protein n=1 Tax=Bulleidia sp. zg-1006 TaxID=2806552 RepID=UPI0019393764|nr:hypothetical protein [Bulleidia sp. zg-1006]QRG86809.1 hypothetical protein JOS54_00365 [Bulleidia sp. zg-1006]